MDQGADLGTADCACATCTEDDLVGCKEESVNESTVMAEGGLTEDALLPDVANVLRLRERHDEVSVVGGKVNQSRQRIMQKELNS